MDAQTVSPIVPKFGMGLDGHLGRIIGYNNNNNNDDDNDNNDNNITTPYNREPLSSIYVQTVAPFVTKLEMGLDGHLRAAIRYYNNNNNNNNNDNNDNIITTPYNREPLSSIYVQTVAPFVTKLDMGLDGHLGVAIGYNNNNNNNNNNNDNIITTPYNREPLSSIYVQTVGPICFAEV